MTESYSRTTGFFDVGRSAENPIQMFYVAYSADRRASDRPVVFAIPGGPGSSGAFLHYGLLGPTVLDFDGWPVNGGHGVLRPNDDGVLKDADLVVIDPIGSGLSTVPPAGDAARFNAAGHDAESLASLVEYWLTANERRRSPCFLLGESYGCIRACLAAEFLREFHGVHVSGLILLASPVMRGRAPSERSMDEDVILGLPSKAVAAAYHERSPNAGEPVSELYERAKRFALDVYGPHLFAGRHSTVASDEAVARGLSNLTGLPGDLILENDLRIDVETFVRSVLGGRGRSIGRYDSRVVGPAYEPLNGPWADESLRLVQAGFAGHASSDLRPDACAASGSHRAYVLVDFARTQPWANAAENEPPGISAGKALQSVIRKVCDARVFVAMGDYDLITPTLAAEWALDHIGLSTEELRRTCVKSYAGGHLMYIESSVRQRLNEDLSAFIGGR